MDTGRNTYKYRIEKLNITKMRSSLKIHIEIQHNSYWQRVLSSFWRQRMAILYVESSVHWKKKITQNVLKQKNKGRRNLSQSIVQCTVKLR